ncbi:MAG: glycoside hydrolase family 3 N-terminal domain-containing protein [Acidimicrobiales bacterium]
MPAGPRGGASRRVYRARRLPTGVVVVLALVIAAGAGTLVARELSSSKPSSQRAPTSSSSRPCSTLRVLGMWSLAALADETIAVPAEETDLVAIAPAARVGYGGVLLFGTAAPLNLGQQLRQLRSDVPGRLGLLVMTDEEGGGIQRMANLVGSMPWPSQMGATMTPAQIQSLARGVGSKMTRHGVNVDLAPVVDVDGRAVEPGAADPDGFRSFSGNVITVEADGVAFLRGLMQAGVVPVVKHFPGLGGATGNTDDGPADTLPWSVLQSGALPPFEAAIKSGVPAVMVSNAIVPGLSGRLPASLSRAVTRELRERLGFTGLIITDSLSALAISDAPLSLGVPEASVRALEAGADMVLFGLSASASGDLALAAAIRRAILAAVAAGQLSRAQLTRAAAEVLATKKVALCRT